MRLHNNAFLRYSPSVCCSILNSALVFRIIELLHLFVVAFYLHSGIYISSIYIPGTKYSIPVRMD